MPTAPRLHLVDGTYELFRAHYSPGPGRTDPSGANVKASVGLARSLLALLDDGDEHVTHIAVAFDHPIESFRNAQFAGYKSSAGVDEELLAQFDLAEEAVRAVGITVWPMDTVEADDALATAAVLWREQTAQVRICTPDKDLAQVVDGRRIVQVDRARGREIDEPAVRAKFGVGPRQIPDYLGLVGDAADGIPGIPGFGAKTAARLLDRYGHIDDIPLDTSWDIDIRGAERLQTTLRQRLDDAHLYRDLARLRTDVELTESLQDLRFDGTDHGRFTDWCAHVGARTLAERPKRWRTPQ
ncbi:MAG: 5'-3' exonuclease H3TH domain-containing protein [Nitriliruptoraceae bacterium]